MSISSLWQRTLSSRFFLPVAVAGALAGLGFTVYVLGTPRVVDRAVSIRQDSLLAGHYPLARVLEAGMQFFTGAYVPADGMGEGEAGPRAAQRAALYPHHPIAFLRMNGLGAQACFECHNAIGFESQTGIDGGPQTRKPGGVGGAAGFASVLFQNPSFPDSLTEFLRNPPHVFGTGYSQRLAWEMTHALHLQALADSIAAFRNPGIPQTVALQAKGLDFGQLTVTYDAETGAFTTDLGAVTGVDRDLIVRPFQNKGIASSVRHFVMTALDFHFSMQPIERAGYDTDCDADGFYNEMAVDVSTASGGTVGGSVAAQQSLGNVAALSALVAMTRPPRQVVPAGMATEVARGEQVFEEIQCASCHAPTLTIDDPVLTIAAVTAADLPTTCPPEAIPKLGADAFASANEHPVAVALYADLGVQPSGDFATRLATIGQNAAFQSVLQQPNVTVAAIYAALQAVLPDATTAVPPGYHIDLTDPDVAGMSDYLRSYITPRLAATNGTVAVPLYSDLRLHDMGEELSDVDRQETDVSGVYTPARLFLTRPIWGVGDTPPYLHDGRARDLREAIVMHAGAGSEANPVIDRFDQLSEADQAALIAFLQSLRLPVQDVYVRE